MEIVLVAAFSLLLALAIMSLVQPDDARVQLDALAREPEEVHQRTTQRIIEVNRRHVDAAETAITRYGGRTMSRHDYENPYAVEKASAPRAPEWVSPKGRSSLDDRIELTVPEESMLVEARGNLLGQEATRRVNDSARRHINGIGVDAATVEIQAVNYLHELGRQPYHPDDEAYAWAIVDETVQVLRPANKAVRDAGIERMGEFGEQSFEVRPDGRPGWKKFLGVR